MKFRFVRFERVTYQFDSEEKAREWIDEQLEEFKLKNMVRDEMTDRSFIRFKNELMEKLENQLLDKLDD